MVSEKSEQTARSFDLNRLPDDFFDDPYPYYAALRDYDPIHLCPDGSYLISKYSDLVQIYRDPRCSSDKQDLFFPKFGASPLYEHHTTSLVFNDPPYHDRVRRLIAGALKPKVVKAMAPDLVRLVEQLLDELEDSREADLVKAYAMRIPIEIIGNLLGVPHEDRGPLRGWSMAILGALEPTLTPEQLRLGNQAVEEFCEYLDWLVTDRKKHLNRDGTDLLSVLILGEGGDRLSQVELFQNCIFLLNAGHETTTNLIANGVYQLMECPDALDLLKGDPTLIKSAIEEMLRYQSPNQLGNRQLTEPVQLGELLMPAGTQITLCIGAANRDPDQFPDPDTFDIQRQPNSHMAFITGIHMCAGMALARLEGQIAISHLIQRFPGLELTGKPAWQKRARFRGLVSLPMRFC